MPKEEPVKAPVEVKRPAPAPRPREVRRPPSRQRFHREMERMFDRIFGGWMAPNGGLLRANLVCCARTRRRSD